MSREMQKIELDAIYREHDKQAISFPVPERDGIYDKGYVLWDRTAQVYWYRP